MNGGCKVSIKRFQVHHRKGGHLELAIRNITTTMMEHTRTLLLIPMKFQDTHTWM